MSEEQAIYDAERVKLVSRVTYPTASFTLTVSLIAWIEAEAKRLGIKKSELVRRVLDDARAQQQAAA